MVSLAIGGCAVQTGDRFEPSADPVNVSTAALNYGNGANILGWTAKCLEVRGMSTAPGTPVQLAACTAGSANWAQQWSTSGSQIQTWYGLCLDVTGLVSGQYGYAGEPVVTGRCDGTSWGQNHWSFRADGTLRTNLANGEFCLTASSYAASSPLSINVCSGWISQQFGRPYANRGLAAPYGITMLSGTMNQALFVGEAVPPAGGHNSLVMQYNCDLVVFRDDGLQANRTAANVLWHSQTGGLGDNCWATMQQDGRFAIYDGEYRLVWSATSPQYPGAFLANQANGDVAVRSADGSRALFVTTGTLNMPCAYCTELGLVCGPNACVKSCTPVTCGSHCGRMADGCGNSLECGACSEGKACGGGGTNNVCGCGRVPGAPACKDSKGNYTQCYGGLVLFPASPPIEPTPFCQLPK